MGKDIQYAIVSKADKKTNVIMMRGIYEKNDAERLAARFPGDHKVVEQDTLPKDLKFGQYKYTA